MRPLLATPTVGAKVQQIEADRHRFDWHTMNPMAHVVTVDGDRLRYQMLARPDGIAHGDPAHDQIAAYSAVAGRLSIPGVPVAVTYTAELCERCGELGTQRTTHLRGHTPTFRVLAGVDITGSRYVVMRRRHDNRLVAMVSPPGSPDDGSVVSLTLYLALAAMLTRHRAPLAIGNQSADEAELYGESRCRTEGCEEDPHDGEGWAG
jgi:hypothetical protein